MKLGLAAATLAAVALSSAAARAERPRIAVMEMGGAKVAPDLRERMTHSVHEGLLASGADVVDGMPAAATGPGGAPCDGNGCVTAVAKATVSGYVLRGTLEIDGRTYELRLEMLDGKTGALIESREDRCEICTEGEALEMAGVSASALKVQVFKKKSVVAAVADAAPVAPPPSAVRVEASAPPPGPSPTGIAASERKRIGWSMVAGGVLLAFGGAILVDLDGKGTCSNGAGVQCPRVYSTTGWGIGTFALGGLELVSGMFVLAGKF